MRIAFLLHQFPAVSETFILRQIVGLLELGHDVRIFSECRCESGLTHPDVTRHELLNRTTFLEAPSESVPYELPAWPFSGTTWAPDTGVPIANRRRLARAAPTLVRSAIRQPRLTREVLSERRYGYQARSLSALYRLSTLAAERTQFDVLHAHFGPVGKNFRFARKLWGAPLVVSFHGYDFSTWPKREGADAYRPLFDEVDLITVHTDFAHQRLLELGCPERLLRRLECGIDLDEFRFHERAAPPDGIARLLTVGRLVEKKGIEYSTRAVAELIARGYRVNYEVIGDGPLRANLAKLIQELGVGDHIALSGARGIDYVRRRMEESHIFMLASVTASDGDTEGAPVSLLEAQACGMPVVSTRHDGIPEIVADNASGLLVPERDVQALAATLARLLDNAGLWPDMGRAGRHFVERKHDLKMLNRRLVDLYQEAIAARRPK
jgi:colanic acid/amylovoran biosynthesis glycosyltransferase